MVDKIKSLERDIQNTIQAIGENNKAITKNYAVRKKKRKEAVSLP